MTESEEGHAADGPCWLPSGALKPPPFEYVAPTSLDEALQALADAGDEAKVLAGGQSLIPLMSLRLAQPAVLIDLNRVPGLDAIERTNGTLRIGALTRHRTVERDATVQEAVPLLAEAMPLIGHPAIRTRGTIGGSAAHADPAAEIPAVALALEATFTARSAARGERTIAAADFFDGYFTTTLEPDEILTAVDLPARTAGSGAALVEVARRHGDYAVCGAGVLVRLDQGLRVASARAALISVGPVPVPVDLTDALGGQPHDAADWAAAGRLAATAVDPDDDIHATAAYRARLVRILTARVLQEAHDDARRRSSAGGRAESRP